MKILIRRGAVGGALAETNTAIDSCQIILLLIGSRTLMEGVAMAIT